MGMRERCVCGCQKRGAHRHHCVTRQELRHAARRLGVPARRLEADERNLVWITLDCHGAHHGRSRPLPLCRLPDRVFEFAVEVLGAGPAYEYLKRCYAGADRRLAALL